ncbi:MAG: hypothetical protein FWC80_01340 [Firmicutes bacterium]|nr:hypothetical protein [Bacillota bacterium]
MKIILKNGSLFALQGFMTEQEFANKLGVSREQLWRIKKRKSFVGKNFVSKFKNAFPNENLDNYFSFVDVEDG